VLFAQLVFETLEARAVRIRLVWDIKSATELIWRNEMSIGGAPWTLVEEYRCMSGMT
jgi:hypothetical protein